jgi:uncharacterized protein
MIGPVAASTPDGARLHLNHGPIDLVIEATGGTEAVVAAYDRAWARFRPLLDELVRELPILRRPARRDGDPVVGSVARRMATAAARFPDRFITPMAAVAGAVADEIADVMWLGAGGWDEAPGEPSGLRRCAVNDGGDIAVRLAPGERFVVGLVHRPDRPEVLGAATILAADPARGVATSGRHGRSFSLGIADAVTVLAADAATADAAATLVANAVDLPGHPAIERMPARDLEPDNDLGARLVTRSVGALTDGEVDEALMRGLREAEGMRIGGTIHAAVLCLEDRVVSVGPLRPAPVP